MTTSAQKLTTLFDRLGLDSNDHAIQTFIEKHRPLPRSTPLHKANIWSQFQAAILEEAIKEDTNFAELVELLESMLKDNEARL